MALFRALPEDAPADAQLVARMLRIPEATASRLLNDLERAGLVAGELVQ